MGYLAVNYRSREKIVSFVNRTFDYVKPPQKAHKSGGYVEVDESADPLEGAAAALSSTST